MLLGELNKATAELVIDDEDGRATLWYRVQGAMQLNHELVNHTCKSAKLRGCENQEVPEECLHFEGMSDLIYSDLLII